MNDSFDPRSYGAVADGRAKDTAAVQAAIDAAAAQGGTVRLAGGIFVCGTLYLKSNVALEITNSATLLASPDIADYGTDTHRPRQRELLSGLEPHHPLGRPQCAGAYAGKSALQHFAP